MNIPTDAIVMTVALIAGFIYLKMQKENVNPKESQPIEIPLSDSSPPKDFTQSVFCAERLDTRKAIKKNRCFLILFNY